MIYIKELLMNCKFTQLEDEYIFAITPLLLAKAFFEKIFISSEAKECLNKLSENCLYESTVNILSQECFNKNANIQELSLTHLAKVVKLMNENISTIS